MTIVDGPPRLKDGQEPYFSPVRLDEFKGDDAATRDILSRVYDFTRAYGFDPKASGVHDLARRIVLEYVAGRRRERKHTMISSVEREMVARAVARIILLAHGVPCYDLLPRREYGDYTVKTKQYYRWLRRLWELSPTYARLALHVRREAAKKLTAWMLREAAREVYPSIQFETLLREALEVRQALLEAGILQHYEPEKQAAIVVLAALRRLRRRLGIDYTVNWIRRAGLRENAVGSATRRVMRQMDWH